MMALLSYVYCDGSNYKRGGQVLLPATPEVASFNFPIPDAAELKTEIERHLDDGSGFIAHQVGIPEVFNWDPDATYDPDDPSTFPADLCAGQYRINDDDHCWHRFEGIEIVSMAMAKDLAGAGVQVLTQTVAHFISALQQAAREGWDEFEPVSRREKSRGLSL